MTPTRAAMCACRVVYVLSPSNRVKSSRSTRGYVIKYRCVLSVLSALFLPDAWSPVCLHFVSEICSTVVDSNMCPYLCVYMPVCAFGDLVSIPRASWADRKKKR